MKTRHVAVNILTGFFATLLCILLVVVAFATVLYSSVTALLTPQNISALAQSAVNEVVQQIDPENMAQENEELHQAITDMGLPAEVVTDLLQSETVDQIIDLYARDIAGLLAGQELTGNVTPEALREILNNNMDEIVQIAIDATGEEVDTEELQTQITTFVNENTDKIIEVLPPVEVLAEPLMESEVADTIQMATNPAILWAAILVCVVLAGLIYALRCYRYGGFMWIGVCATLAGLLLASVCAAIRNPLFATLLEQSAAELAPVVSALASVFAGRLLLRMVIVLLVAALFITGYILLYYLVVKKKKEAAPAADASAIEAPIVEAPAIEAPVETAE